MTIEPQDRPRRKSRYRLPLLLITLGIFGGIKLWQMFGPSDEDTSPDPIEEPLDVPIDASTDLDVLDESSGLPGLRDEGGEGHGAKHG